MNSKHTYPSITTLRNGVSVFDGKNTLTEHRTHNGDEKEISLLFLNGMEMEMFCFSCNFSNK